MGRVRRCPRPSSVRPVSEFCVLGLLCWTPGPPPRPSRVWVMVQIGVLWGEDGRKLLFCHDDDATLCKSDFKLFSVIVVAEIALVC